MNAELLFERQTELAWLGLAGTGLTWLGFVRPELIWPARSRPGLIWRDLAWPGGHAGAGKRHRKSLDQSYGYTFSEAGFPSKKCKITSEKEYPYP